MLTAVEPQFTNAKNADIYEDMSRSDYERFLNAAGLAGNIDLNLIKKRIMSARSILIVGAGFGREIKQIIEWGYTGHLDAIERSNKQFHLLRDQFEFQVNIFHGDVLSYELCANYDLVLLMFGTIFEFNHDEVLCLLENLKSCLAQDGVILIDSMNGLQCEERFSELLDDFYKVVNRGKELCSRIIFDNTVKSEAEGVGLKYVKATKYTTQANISRKLHVLSH